MNGLEQLLMVLGAHLVAFGEEKVEHNPTWVLLARFSLYFGIAFSSACLFHYCLFFVLDGTQNFEDHIVTTVGRYGALLDRELVKVLVPSAKVALVIGVIGVWLVFDWFIKNIRRGR